MEKPTPYGEFLKNFFGNYENTVVYSASGTAYTALQKGLLDAFLLCFEANANEETEVLRAIIPQKEQLFLAPPSPYLCEGLYAFHLGPKKGVKLNEKSKKLLETVYANFPEAKAAGVLMIYDDTVEDQAASAKGKKAWNKLLTSLQ